MYENDSKVHVLDHPLLQHKLSILRDERTGVKEFREIVSEIATLECYEATRDLPTEEVEIKTPVATGTFRVLAGKKLAIVPILRAGLGMVEGILTLIPSAKVGHIGLYRDPETLAPVEYYCKMPNDIAERDVIVLDPMLATGGSAVAAIHFMKNYGCKHIKLMNILAAPWPPLRASRPCGRPTPTWTSTWPVWTRSSTTTATSSPVWETPATGSSAPSKLLWTTTSGADFCSAGSFCVWELDARAPSKSRRSKMRLLS